jgi:signal transduction histidine kinase
MGQDRYRVVDNLQRTVGQPFPSTAQWQPKLLFASDSFAQGQHDRTVTLQAYWSVTDTQPVPRPVTVVYTRSAAEFDAKMHRLAIAYILSGLAIGLLTAAIAVKVSKSALKPLAATNQQIASIDEQHLDRRIDVAALPAELMPMAERLNELLARLQAAFLQRNRFLADASHELRTPVAALVTRLQVAARHPRSSDFYRQLVEECSHEADQLRLLIEQLMQQVRSQNLVYNESAEELDLAALLQQCMQTVSALSGAKGLTMKAPSLPPMWYVLPPQRMRSVVLNLLSNAIEYTQSGGSIELDCKHDLGHIQIDITDTGVGIAPEHLPHIFEPFYRTDAARVHETGHLGLGLSLVRSHLQAIGGTCQVTSVLGAGSTFSIKIPEKLLKSRESPHHLESASMT